MQIRVSRTAILLPVIPPPHPILSHWPRQWWWWQSFSTLQTDTDAEFYLLFLARRYYILWTHKISSWEHFSESFQGNSALYTYNTWKYVKQEVQNPFWKKKPTYLSHFSQFWLSYLLVWGFAFASLPVNYHCYPQAFFVLKVKWKLPFYIICFIV